MFNSKMKLAKNLLDNLSEESISEEDLNEAEKKSSNLKGKINDFKLLLSMFRDGASGKYKISSSTLATIGGAILYVVSPIDAIPDVIPLLGWTDDIAIIGFVMNRITKEIEKYKEFKSKKNE